MLLMPPLMLLPCRHMLLRGDMLLLMLMPACCRLRRCRYSHYDAMLYFAFALPLLRHLIAGSFVDCCRHAVTLDMMPLIMLPIFFIRANMLMPPPLLTLRRYADARLMRCRATLPCYAAINVDAAATIRRRCSYARYLCRCCFFAATWPPYALILMPAGLRCCRCCHAMPYAP